MAYIVQFICIAFIAIVMGYFHHHGYWYLPWISGTFKTPMDVHKAYDYVVEDPSRTVLLLEAGGDETKLWWSHIPGFLIYNQLTSIDWKHKTESQKLSSFGLYERLKWPSGKVVGGTSVMNHMCYVRGNPGDYDRWNNTRGCAGWSYKDILPFFKKMESVVIPGLEYSEHRGHDGPLTVTETFATPTGDAVLAAAKRLGYDVLKDYNGPKQEGFGRFQFNINKWGRRQSTAYCYLRPAMRRSNLHVMKTAHVTKVTLDSNKVATGVEYIFNGDRHTIRANQEVILSAGAMNSPKILMLSGIGPKKHLEELDIPVIHASPFVGQNLINHVWTGMTWSINSSNDAINQKDSDFLRTLQYMLSGNGRLRQTGLEITGFVKTVLQPVTDVPDMQLYFSPMDIFGGAARYFNFKPYVSEAGEALHIDGQKVTFLSSVQQTTCFGELRLRSKDPEAYPSLDPRQFENERDLMVIVEGLKIAKKIVDQPEFQKFDPKFAELPMPGCEKFQMWSDDFLKCYTRHKTVTMYHHAGTCKMGPSIHNSVVDTRLRVHGVGRLRVVDASIFPDHVAGNTNVPIMAIAEKAAHMIKEDVLGAK